MLQEQNDDSAVDSLKAPGLVTNRTTVTFAISILLASKITASQGVWLELIQRRINFTSAVLGSMRNVKMLGLETQMATNIEDIRTREIESSKRFRKLLCLNVALGKSDQTQASPS